MANIQQQFLSELSDALSTDRKLSTCDREVQNYVDIQKDRLRKKGLLLDYEFTLRGHNPEGKEMAREAKDEHYVAKMWTSTTKYTRLLQRNGKRINKKKMNANVWSVVINYLNGQNMGDEIYNCPNCGNPEKIKALTEGCPYCGTSFKMDELYPKVTAYNIVEDYSKEKKEMLKFYLIVSAITAGVLIVAVPVAALVIAVIAAVIMAMMKVDPSKIMQMLMLPLGALGQGIFTAPIMGLIIGGLILFGNLLIGAAKSAPLLATFASHKKFEEELKKYGTVQIDRDMCIICVVGDLRCENTGFESLITSGLQNIPVRMISYGGSNHNISFVVSGANKQMALQELSKHIFK